MFNGVERPGRRPVEVFYDVWGTDKTYNHMAVRLDLGVRHAVHVDQADRLALRRHAPGHVRVLAGPHQGRGRHPQPVPSRHRRRADHPRGHAASRAPEVVDGIKQKPIEGVSLAYTFDKANANAPSRHKTQYFEMMGDRAHLSRRLDRQHQGRSARRGMSPARSTRIRSTTARGSCTT